METRDTSDIVPSNISATAVRNAISCMAHALARQLPEVSPGDVIVHYAKDATGEPDMFLLAWVEADPQAADTADASTAAVQP